MILMDVENLLQGMIVGRPIYSSEGRCLINTDVILTTEVINKIAKLNYDKMWIKEAHEEVAECDLLSERLKQQMLRSMISAFGVFAKEKALKGFDHKKIDELKLLIEDVVDEIVRNKDCVIQLSNLKSYDNNTYEHSLDVARISTLIGANMGMEKAKLIQLCEAAILHDVGKTAIPSEVINKKGKLTAEEYDDVKWHSTYGYEIVKRTGRFEAPVYVAILQHHESFDGTGYPNGLIGDKISLLARIIAIADVYSAMTSARPYKEAFFQNEVREKFYADGSKQFDPDILKVFLDKVPIYEIGEVVKISTGQKAVIVRNNLNYLLRPVIRIFEDCEKLGSEINLLDKSFYNITIVA